MKSNDSLDPVPRFYANAAHQHRFRCGTKTEPIHRTAFRGRVLSRLIAQLFETYAHQSIESLLVTYQKSAIGRAVVPCRPVAAVSSARSRILQLA